MNYCGKHQQWYPLGHQCPQCGPTINVYVTGNTECQHEWTRHLVSDYCLKCRKTKPITVPPAVNE